MPPTRKVSGQRTAAAGNRQATLSFNHRVTKASVPKQSAKEAALLPAKADKESKAKRDAGEEEEVEEEERRAAKDEPAVEEVGAKGDEDGLDAEPEQPAEEPLAAAARPAAEIEAEAVTDAQIRRYWQSIEAQGTARRVHQEDLVVGEKVLRHFDVSSQFGPCVGIARKKRWMRAQRLGLAPPIEVLAVLLQEEAKGVPGVQQSSLDSILNGTAAT